MIDPQSALELLSPDGHPSDEVFAVLNEVGFEDLAAARARFQTLCDTDLQRAMCAQLMPALLHALNDAASPDASLLNFQRFIQSSEDRDPLIARLVQQPRAVEILVKLFVGSQFLTEILLRNPHYLDELTEHKRLAEFKSRGDFAEHGRREVPPGASLPEVMTQLRRFQQWELLRLAACDTFGLMDLKTVTLQLALLADALVQISLERVAQIEGLPLDDFVVLAFGKLGGEELNYSSDIDLVFVCEREAERYWGVGQKLIKTLAEATDLGFLYRVDMRLRPWGDAGALVTTADAYVDYMKRNGQLWEKQALLKARPIAGNLGVGFDVLARLESCIFEIDPGEVRRNIRQMKKKIEDQLARRGHRWGEVKGGPGGIRDIEFVTQFLQLTYGGRRPEVRSINTLDGLVRLAEQELIFPEEFRRLTEGYIVLRTIEHALQLLHNKQEHSLPRSDRRLAYLARRLDFPDTKTFLEQYELHSHSVREIFERYLHHDQHPLRQPAVEPTPVDLHFGRAAENYHECFSNEAEQQHVSLLNDLGSEQLIRVRVDDEPDGRQRVTIVGVDRIGELAAICGLMFAYGLDIVSGNVFTGADVEASGSQGKEQILAGQPRRVAGKKRTRKFVNVFHVRPTTAENAAPFDPELWTKFETELNDLLNVAEKKHVREAQGRLARRVAEAMEGRPAAALTLLPLEIDIDDVTDADATILHIRGEDTPGFLYELTNAIAVSGLSINRMTIQSVGNRVIDTLHVVDEKNRRIQNGDRLNELRAAIVLIKHFTHLLSQSPNPASALIHFQQFLENLFKQPNWLEQLSPLQDSDVLGALATLLGISDFLWDDFLRLQHENLFPVVTNVEGLQQPRDKAYLTNQLKTLLENAPEEGRIEAINAFKDREMMRADMRHILGLQDKFGMFGRELTYVAEVVVDATRKICESQLKAIHGEPLLADGSVAKGCICALGKFGGRELGYASDIELMFLFEGDGQTAGPDVISNLEYFQRLVHEFRRAIRSKRKGIFEVDLRLRPYGKAGSLAVSYDSFAAYFGPTGPAWPYERQALVKLRPVAGSSRLGKKIVQLRDSLIYRGEPFDVAAMRAMREKQVRQLVRPGTFNAKLSPGGLVDCEYLVQGLQITFGHLDKAIREPNTREAMKALEAYGLLTGESRVGLRDAYRFLRRVIDGLRVVRGDASDLTVPPHDSEEFEFLARRLGYHSDAERLRRDFERHTRHVLDVSAALPAIMQREPTPQHSR
ncbi:[protein-PII] uridylyltransferase family protein [Planctomicrobium piriforme]|uniref:Glutamate-ammonia-ligase adenylyltransferase n=1 Tax=Planctomicrobium piriforme TaxID=1576369 RepID=A0A1I3JI45_9PLAN|nr:glutamine synthetase adenylyltransferase [Planctomicrobium piriforme]SFI59844.1 glutamate-ammonia-ligase adenylyltransferase [Planctomicrobium piriforme]